MNETFALLSEVMELSPGSSKALIIILNKLDLFKEKMATVESAKAFKAYFTEYKGMQRKLMVLTVDQAHLNASLQRLFCGSDLSIW